MASNIKYPENSCVWYIEGDNFVLLTNVDSSGNLNTTERKNWKAIQEAVTDGILIKYYAEPDSVSSLSDVPDIDNSLHLALVDYVKKCLYMDKSGTASDGNISSAAMQMSQMHEKNFNDAVIRYGMKKRDKTGGSRVLKSVSLL